MPEGRDTRAKLYYGAYEGVVTANVDPEGLGRIRVLIPGILEPQSDWIRPFATFGGSKDRGIFAVPKVNANACVIFLHGDPRFPRYVAGCWGRPGGVSEVPAQAPQGNPDIVVIRFGDFAVIVDETTGAEKATLLDIRNDSLLRFDIAQQSVELTAKKDLDVKTLTGKRTATIAGDDDAMVAGKLTITVNGGNAEINVTAGDAKVTASGKVEIEAPEIKLGSAAAVGVVLASIKTWLEGHIHSGGTGPGGNTGVPTIPTIPTDFSTTVKAKQ